MNLLANYANRPPSKRAMPIKLQQGGSQPKPRQYVFLFLWVSTVIQLSQLKTPDSVHVNSGCL